MDASITLRKLEIKDCPPDLLRRFNRFQEVKRCWRREAGEWVLKDVAFTERWDDGQKVQKVAGLVKCLQRGGAVIGAFRREELVGFSSIGGVAFGAEKEYIDLDMLHVSHEARGCGIGRALFNAACAAAKELGAKKLYISAHPSEETQKFYSAMGCRDAAEINPALFAAEPLDRHMECLL